MRLSDRDRARGLRWVTKLREELKVREGERDRKAQKAQKARGVWDQQADLQLSLFKAGLDARQYDRVGYGKGVN